MALATMRTDAQIKTDVLNELEWDSRVDETEVGVQVKDGVVTLAGHVPAYTKKLAAIQAAHRVHGVLDVVSELEVKSPAFWKRSDQDVAKAVRHALQLDVLVPEQRITSTITDGVVALRGKVDSWAQRQDAEGAIHRLAGIKGVINQITVEPKAADATTIKHQIEDALERQAEREAKRVSVKVNDGVVLLTGTVRSWGERRAIEGAAGFASGVRRIDNRTTVDPYS